MNTYYNKLHNMMEATQSWYELEFKNGLTHKHLEKFSRSCPLEGTDRSHGAGIRVKELNLGITIDAYRDGFIDTHGSGVTRSWKIYGRGGDWNRASKEESSFCDFTNEYDGIRLLGMDCYDVTGSYDYVVVTITRNTAKECLDELRGQISDGMFENYRVGRREEITIGIADE